MNSIVERLLSLRGITGEELAAYLDPSLKRLADAFAIPGIPEAVDAIMPFLGGKRPIVVFGDYDCDGVCASAILVTTLRRLGAKAEAFLPDRFIEGYGMTAASVERMLKEHPDAALVITVDNGITSAVEVEMLENRGVAVVVTDHHLPPERVPSCRALVDPKLDSQCDAAAKLGVGDLCGAGIAFFLASALASRAVATGLYAGGKFSAPLLVLAGLATVVDIMPLCGQNRILAANALRAFRAAPVGLQELLLRAQRRPVDLTSRDFSFLLGPRINAAGRMASAVESYNLLMATDREEARNLAQAVDAHNAERKTVENRMSEEANAQIPENIDAAIVVGSCSADGASCWHTGLCGIVASRLVERYGVPVAVSVDGRGSVRAPDGYDVHAALAECTDALDRFGGHSAAGGFTIKAGEGGFERFKAAFIAACAAQGKSCTKRECGEFREPELWIGPGDLTMELYDALKMMEPFGEGNPEPVFGLRGVAVDARPLGENGRHLSVTFPEQRIPRATWWNHGELVERIRARSFHRFDVSFTLDASDWNGEDPYLELRLCGIMEA